MGDVYVESAWRVSVLGIYRKRRAFSGLLRHFYYILASLSNNGAGRKIRAKKNCAIALANIYLGVNENCESKTKDIDKFSRLVS